MMDGERPDWLDDLIDAELGAGWFWIDLGGREPEDPRSRSPDCGLRKVA